MAFAVAMDSIVTMSVLTMRVIGGILVRHLAGLEERRDPNKSRAVHHGSGAVITPIFMTPVYREFPASGNRQPQLR